MNPVENRCSAPHMALPQAKGGETSGEGMTPVDLSDGENAGTTGMLMLAYGSAFLFPTPLAALTPRTFS